MVRLHPEILSCGTADENHQVQEATMTKIPGRVLVVGDVMLDEYVTGTISRMSPEAPIPVFLEQDREYRVGGAANVAAGIEALGVRTALISVVGQDTDGEQLIYL